MRLGTRTVKINIRFPPQILHDEISYGVSEGIGEERKRGKVDVCVCVFVGPQLHTRTTAQ